MKKSIVFIVREPVGGIWKHIEILVEYFSKMNEIIIIGDLVNGDKKFQLFKDKNREIEYLDVPIDKNPSISDFTNIKAIKNHLKHKNIDVVHGHGAKGGIYARVLGLSMTAKVIYTPHGGSVHSSFGKVQTIFYRLVECALYFITNKVVVESNYTNEKYRKMLFMKTDKSEKIILNYNGIDCKSIQNICLLSSKRFNSTTVISSFGMLRHEKGQDILILAVKKLIDMGIPIKLHIYGEGSARQEYEKLIEKNSINDCVFLHGEIDDVEVKMKESDIIVQPSRFESFGYVLLEGMCVGVPIIASDTGGMSEIMEHRKNGLIFKNEDIDSLVKEISYMIDNVTNIEGYVIEGRKTIATRFSSEAMCKNLSKIYQEL